MGFQLFASFTRFISKLALGCALGYAAIFAVTQAPQLHNYYLRETVGSKVYYMQIAPHSGGGTGFAMKAKSGKTILITNDHVCEHAEDGRLLVTGEDGTTTWRKILERSDYSDICVLEALPDEQGLSLASSNPAKGEIVYAVGHPRLRPLSVSGGEVVGVEDVPIVDYVLPSGDPLLDAMLNTSSEGKSCKLLKNEIAEFPISIMGMPAGTVRVCLVITKNAYMTTAVIYPGNSGSPAVDYMGNVIGIFFAADPSTNYGEVVSRKDLAQTLNKY